MRGNLQKGGGDFLPDLVEQIEKAGGDADFIHYVVNRVLEAPDDLRQIGVKKEDLKDRLKMCRKAARSLRAQAKLPLFPQQHLEKLARECEDQAVRLQGVIENFPHLPLEAVYGVGTTSKTKPKPWKRSMLVVVLAEHFYQRTRRRQFELVESILATQGIPIGREELGGKAREVFKHHRGWPPATLHHIYWKDFEGIKRARRFDEPK